MQVGILGSAGVGQSLASGFVKHGHAVTLGTRNPQSPEVQQWLAQTPGGRVGSFAEAAAFGDLLVLAFPGYAASQVIAQVGPQPFVGKVVIDPMNPIESVPPVNGVLRFFTGPNQSLAEQVQSLLPASHVVKAFNSVGHALMVNPHFEQGTPTMFICGNDEAAKQTVAGVIRQFGWEPYDCGMITSARALEPLCQLWCLPTFIRNEWTHAFRLLTR